MYNIVFYIYIYKNRCPFPIGLGNEHPAISGILIHDYISRKNVTFSLVCHQQIGIHQEEREFEQQK